MTNIPAARIWFPPEDRQAILAEIEQCLQSGALTLGRKGRDFEEAFARRVGVRHAVAVNSGTSALEIPLRILGVEGKEVLVPTNTFFATAAALLHAGGRPRFVDTDPETLGIDLASLVESITPRTAGVIVVHIGGVISPHVPEIQRICRERGLFLLEDAAHAHGSTLDGRAAGSFGCAAAFSFYPTKVITSGEGGMLVTDDTAMYEAALQYRDQGKAGFHTNLHVQLGSNWRMSEPHAIIGLAQLRRLDEFIAERRRVAAEYDRRLAGVEAVRPLREPPGCVSNYYKYIAYLEPGLDRAELKKSAREQHGVSLGGEVYDTPCHRQPVFAGLVEDGPVLSNADEVCARHICLPIYVGMTSGEIDRVVAALAAVTQPGSVS